MSIVRCGSIDQQKERIMKNKKLVFLSTCAAVLSLTACGNKAESNVVETATPAPTATASPAPTATPIPENHDIDTAIDQFKDENNIEINPDDIGTDIPDTSILYDWLYTNGVTRESVQNDRDSGCKNPYLDGYLEYLDNLDKPSENTSNTTEIDFSKADAVHDGSEFGLTTEVYEIDGKYYIKNGLEISKNEDGSWSAIVPDLGVADSITKEEIDASTQKVVDAFNDQEYNNYVQGLVDKYGG